ncbi:MAG TPA: phosphatase PAP2 family protein, partial [Candidatus Krumholzibacteria bacterium]|nr:phosphatase PAP2 family protein [Candidatus Krumholzibacteria bacterium]
DAAGSAAVHLATDLHEQLAYPFALAGRDPTRFVVGATGIVALILTDRITYSPMAEPTFLPPGKLLGPARTLSHIGNTQHAIPLVLGFGAVGLITGSDREKQTSIMLAEALVTSGLWTSALKYVAGRERPRELHEAVADWTGPGGAFGEDGSPGGHASFPSGHATGIWAAATVLAHQYPSHRVVPTLAYGTAVAISYSRMVVKAHFLSDVVVGGLIGYGCARQVIGAHEAAEKNRLHFFYQPAGGEQRVGITMDF